MPPKKYRKSMGMTLQDMVDDVRAQMEEKLRVRGRSLEAQLRKAGRMLPRHVRRDGAYLARAVALTENPKLARMVNLRQAQAAHRNIMAHLSKVDLAAERTTAFLNLLASIAFALLSTGVLLLFVLWARGFI
ncbi:MAG: hypothetical protein AAFU41_14210 [Pseudomonadota bacterium]